MCSDLTTLMDHPENRDGGTLLRKVDYRVRPFQEVEAEYLQLFGILSR